MNERTSRDNATSNVLAWTSHCANVEASADEEAGADADEPPDRQPQVSTSLDHFKRAPVHRGSEQHESLLTKALQSHSEDEEALDTSSILPTRRRRSITSNFSLASTAELTCDTGITTPARTSSPSPRLRDIGFVSLAPKAGKPPVLAASPARPLKAESIVASIVQPPTDPAVQALEKKRCISFACAAKPNADGKALMLPPPKPVPSAVQQQQQQQQPRTEPKPAKRTCIKFVCPAQPSKTARPEPAVEQPLPSTPVSRKAAHIPKVESSSSVKKIHRSPSTACALRSPTPRRSPQTPVVAVRPKKCLTATTKDLQSEGARFHEFARDEPADDDWIRCDDDATAKRKITIHDTLEKENVIRKLAKEAEEEADLEDQLDEEENDDADDDDDVDDADDAEDEEGVDENDDEYDVADAEDDASEYGSDDDISAGYNTDNEVGFAESDDEDDGLLLWTTGKLEGLDLSATTPVRRRGSIGDDCSDSSAYSKLNTSAAIRSKNREKSNSVAIRLGTPELPDSTDFVCGTLDEDRPLEEAYLSRKAARKQEKHYPIPQDIDPSFPTSEPEDEAEDLYNQGRGESDEHLWLHGELEDLDHDQQDRTGRKKKSDKHYSPKRHRSPPPKRLHSPPPLKARGRSPKRLFDRHSPQRLNSPPQNSVQSPPASPVRRHHAGDGIAFEALAARPGPTHTKSLPKVPETLFPQPQAMTKGGRRARANTVSRENNHVRGAIDIVKGLEKKRQRRKEKFSQKYCNRARKEKTHEKRPLPGQGAERMREIGLLMAGKIGQGNYVISV